MQYDPIKATIGNVVRGSIMLRRLFYTLLGIFFLREWHVKRMLRRHLKDAKAPYTIYDAGSGFGQYSYYMARHFRDVQIHAIDVKEEQIDDCRRFFRARGITNCSFSVEDLLSIGHREMFDFILSVDVMEHIEDDRTVFANFFTALKPGGRVFINTPSDQGGSDAGSTEDESFIGEHARNGYGMDELREKLETAGLRVVEARYTYGPYGNRAWKLGIQVPMMLLNVSRMFFVVLPFYYVVTLPFVLPLMYLDYVIQSSRGTGLNVLAEKPK